MRKLGRGVVGSRLNVLVAHLRRGCGCNWSLMVWLISERSEGWDGALAAPSVRRGEERRGGGKGAEQGKLLTATPNARSWVFYSFQISFSPLLFVFLSVTSFETSLFCLPHLCFTCYKVLCTQTNYLVFISDSGLCLLIRLRAFCFSDLNWAQYLSDIQLWYYLLRKYYIWKLVLYWDKHVFNLYVI